MQELQQETAGSRGKWFRVGMVSATALAPLLRRWQTLRAAERARLLWEAGRQGTAWPWQRHVAEVELPPAAQRGNVRTGLWLAGVGIGLVAAGTAAFFYVRRRMESTEEEPFELPLAQSNGRPHTPAGQLRDMLARNMRPGASPGKAVPGERPAPAGREAAAMTGGQFTEPEQQNASPEADDTDLAHRERLAQQLRDTGASYTLPDGAPAGVVDPTRAPFIGDIRTMVYHEATDENLPAEENRVYFASREEAELAGYHADRTEAPQGRS